MSDSRSSPDPAELKRRLLVEATALERVRQQVAEARGEEQRWLERAELARTRGRTDLVEQATTRAAEHRERAGYLEADLIDQRQRVEEARQQLRLSGVQPSPDAAQLLASLDLDPAEAALSDLERQARVDRDLADLKAKIGTSSRQPPAEDAPTDRRRTE